MKKILVPVDFSANALKAGLYAAEIAVKSNAAVCFAHVAEPGTVQIHQPFILHEKYYQLAAEDRKAAIQQFTQNFTAMYPSLNITTALLDGPTADAIVEYSREYDFDLIVMGTKGAGPLKEILIGSITALVIAKSSIPVLAVPQEYELEEPDALLLATNHFEKDTNLLNPVIEIARLFSAAVHVVLFEEAVEEPKAAQDQNEQLLQQYLHFLQTTYPGISFKSELLKGSSFEGAIERYYVNNEPDIIAMVTYPHNFLQKMMRKSMTRKMAMHSRIPILALPVRHEQVTSPAK